MEKIKGLELSRSFKHLLEAGVAATYSNCLRLKVGAKIVKNINGRDKDLSRAFNSPPGNKQLEFCLKDSLPRDFKSDKTCCVHAEERAIIEASKNFSDYLLGSTIYLMKLDINNRIIFAEKPYCTICSKLALDYGIKEWVLWHKQGFYKYDAEEFNEISFGRREWKL